MTVIRVDDPGDGRLADYRNVPDAELLARRNVFLAEGRLVVRRLLDGSRLAARSVMVTAPALAALEDVLALHPDLPVYAVPQAVMNGITGLNMHRGCLAIGERPGAQDWRSLAAAARLLVVLEAVADADNVGAIFRNAIAFGVDAVLTGPSGADPLYRKTIRTSMGASLRLPFAPAEPWPQALAELRAAGWAVVAMTPSPAAGPLPQLTGTIRGRRIAVLVGHEGHGLTAAALEACEYHARIPMAAGVDSINVATALAVALYEFTGDGRTGA